MAIDKNLLLVLGASGIGQGEPDLGEKLMGAFLEKLLESGRLPAKIICMNSGIFLTTEGSSMLEIFRKIESGGTEILSCGTCLAYFNRTEKLCIGKTTNMKETVAAMLEYGKILSP
jgi:selenium metabolism protein YedF